MRSTVVLRDDLVEDAKRLTGIRTNREVIETALEELVMARRREGLIAMLGKVDFDLTQEQLEQMRAED